MIYDQPPTQSVSVCYGTYGPFLEEFEGNIATPTNVIVFVTVVTTFAAYYFARCTITDLVICSLMTRLKQKVLVCQEIPILHIVEITRSAREILATYDSVHSGFGGYFLYSLSHLQFLWLFGIFVSISSAIPGSFDSHTISTIAGFCILSLASGLQVSSFVNCIDSGYKSLGELAKVLRRMIPDIKHAKDRRQIKIIVQVGTLSDWFQFY